MWLVMKSRSPYIATVWPGRRLVAVADALAWPLLLIFLVTHVATPTGGVGIAVVSGALLAAVFRMWHAAFRNQHYRFTTTRWACVLGWLLAFGLAISALQTLAMR